MALEWPARRAGCEHRPGAEIYRPANRASIIDSIADKRIPGRPQRGRVAFRRRGRSWRRAAASTGVACLLAGSLAVAQFSGFTEDFLDYIKDEYGGRARGAMEDWEELVHEIRGVAEQEKLKEVNLFFNKRIWFVEDRSHWGRDDYWATPMETMATLGGDCEDFVIAKYFTLREAGVPDERMRLTYVRSTLVDQPHMVLVYYATPDAEPLVLDNLMDAIRPASKRRDLTPVYSFNGRSLWRAKEFGRGREVGSAGSVNLWTDVIRRMRAEDFPY